MKQVKAWVDMWHDEHTGDMCWGIECDDPDLTFDGHFMCVIPGAPSASNQGLAEIILNYMKGKKQIAR